MFVAVDLATIAFAQHHGDKAMAGPLLGLYGLGSAIAGVWYGTRQWRAAQASRLRLALAATALGVAPLAFMPGIWPMAAAITAAGVGISTTLTSSYRIAEMAVPAAQRTEAMSWLTTAAATGTALGAPLAGGLIDSYGAAAGYLFAFAVGLAAVAITIARRRDLAPQPEPRGCASQPAGNPEKHPHASGAAPAPPGHALCERSPQCGKSSCT
jgi:MFS family permease